MFGFENKHNKQSLQNDPGTHKQRGMLKCNKTIYSTPFSALVNIAFQCSIAHHIALNEVQKLYLQNKKYPS